jgi:hypothetical protein
MNGPAIIIIAIAAAFAVNASAQTSATMSSQPGKASMEQKVDIHRHDRRHRQDDARHHAERP